MERYGDTYDVSGWAMDPERLRAAFRLIDREAEQGEIPGGVAVVGFRGAVIGVHAAGFAVATDAEKVPATPETVYDCASLTKVTATLPLALMLVDRGDIRLDDPVARFIPAFGGGGKEVVTVKQLLTHSAGLPAYVKLYDGGLSPEEIRARVRAIELEYEPGTQTVYSDIGFMLLGDIVSHVLDEPLDAAAHRLVFEPLGMRVTRFCPPDEWRPKIAATEYAPSLGRHKRGEVHDENAYALGGVSGHAGLFSTAGDLAKYAAMWLNGGCAEGKTLLSPACVAAAVRNWTPGLNGNRGLGWVLKGDKWDASGDWFSDRSYGHTGFTGVSVWIDPARQLFAVLMTNRVHFGRDKSVARLRACFHNAVAASLVRV